MKRLRSIRKEFLQHLYRNDELEDYLIAEMKRRIVFEMIEYLPFKVETCEKPDGTEYRITLDVAVGKWNDFVSFYKRRETMQNE